MKMDQQGSFYDKKKLITLLTQHRKVGGVGEINYEADIEITAQKMIQIEKLGLAAFPQELALCSKYIEKIRTAVEALWFRDYIKYLIEHKKDFQALKNWTKVILNYFLVGNLIVQEHIANIRLHMLKKMELVDAVLMDRNQDPELVTYLFYWGIYPYREIIFHGTYRLNLLEYAITLGSRELITPEYQNNKAVEAMLLWHRVQRCSYLWGCDTVSSRGPIYHYAIATGNLTALWSLLQAQLDLLAVDSQGHNLMDLLIEYPKIQEDKAPLYNFLHLLSNNIAKDNNRELLRSLYHLFMHQDDTGTTTYNRLYYQLADESLSQTTKEFYIILYRLLLAAIFNHIGQATPQINNEVPDLLAPFIVDWVEKYTIVDMAIKSEEATLPDPKTAYEEICDWLDSLYKKEDIAKLTQVLRHADLRGIQTWQRLLYHLSLITDQQSSKAHFLNALKKIWLRLILWEKHNKKIQDIVWPHVPPIQLPADRYTKLKEIEPTTAPSPPIAPILMSQGVGQSPRPLGRKKFKN